MKLKVPILRQNKLRLLAIILILFSFFGIAMDRLFPQTSPLKINRQEQVTSSESVYISGEVVSPGVYEITSQTKLFEIIDLAGGFTELADPNYIATQLNLAELLQDEQHINIPFESTEEVDSGKININSASEDQLTQLPGVGPSLAKQLVASRPYTLPADLLQVTGIGEAKLSQFVDGIEF